MWLDFCPLEVCLPTGRKAVESEVNMNVKWWKAAGIRAVRTLAQTAAATIGTSAVLSEINWPTVISASVVAALLSLLTSVAGLPEVEEDA